MAGLIYDGLGAVEGRFHTNPSSVLENITFSPLDTFSGAWELVSDNSSFYYKKEASKTGVVLSISEADLPTTITNLTKDGEKSSSAFVVSSGGAVYQLFDPKYWSYHLPKGAVGGTQKMSRDTISIVLCNHGELSLRANTLFTKDGEGYCVLSQKDAYFKGGYEKRGYHASFPKVQMTALFRLLNKVCYDFSIEKKIVNLVSRGKVLGVDHGFTVLGAENFANDSMGPGPAFNWEVL